MVEKEDFFAAVALALGPPPDGAVYALEATEYMLSFYDMWRDVEPDPITQAHTHGLDLLNEYRVWSRKKISLLQSS